MTIELTTFSAPQPGYDDKRIGNFAMAFEDKPRRAPFFSNILVDAMWATWMPNPDYPATLKTAKMVLKGDDSPYPDSAMIAVKPEHASQAKAALAQLMATWAQGKSTVLGYSVEESIALAYRDMGDAGLFVFIYCSYLEGDAIEQALQSVNMTPGYTVIVTQEECSGPEFLASMRDSDPEWFEKLEKAGVIDDKCILDSEMDDDE